MDSTYALRLALWVLTTVGSALLIAAGIALVVGIIVTATGEGHVWAGWALGALAAGARLYLASAPAQLWELDDVDVDA